MSSNILIIILELCRNNTITQQSVSQIISENSPFLCTPSYATRVARKNDIIRQTIAHPIGKEGWDSRRWEQDTRGGRIMRARDEDEFCGKRGGRGVGVGGMNITQFSKFKEEVSEMVE